MQRKKLFPGLHEGLLKNVAILPTFKKGNSPFVYQL